MNRKNPSYASYLLAASLGAIGGGLLVAVFSRAVPRIMSKMMAEMMTEMDCDPAEI